MIGNIDDKTRYTYKLVIAIFINLFIALVLLEAIEVSYSHKLFVIVLISSALSVLWWSLVFKRPLIIIVLAFIFLITIFILKKYYEVLYSSFIYKMDDFIKWAIRYVSELTFTYENYLLILIVLITFILALITFLFVIKINKTYPLIILGTLLFLYEWFDFIDNSIIYYGFFIFFVMILYVIRKYSETESIWLSENKKIAKNMLKRILIYSMIVCMMVITLSFILPKDIEPITWRWLDDKAQEVFPELVNWRNSQKGSAAYGMKNVFDMSFTQFQKNLKRLGGPVETSNELVMEVETSKPIYLRGRVKDFYTGSYWKKTNSIGYRQYSKSKISFVAEEQDKAKAQAITIKHKNLATSTIFSPYLPNRVILYDDIYYSTEELELYTSNIILMNQPYTVYSVNPEIDWKTISESNFKLSKEFNKYLQLPETTTARTYELAKNITKYKNNDYNKVKAIENYLKTIFKYSLTPPDTPYNTDFVDYFLFELKEGYCTYYASSMAVLARCIGVPSRYVEGFRVVEKKDNGTYNVYSSNAHAWVEIYIEGYGWMTFEPTPGFSNQWLSEQRIEEEKEVKETTEYLYSSLRRRKDVEGLADYQIADVDTGYKKDIRTEGPKAEYQMYIKTFIGILTVLILSILIYIHILLKRNKKYLSNKHRVIQQYEYIENFFGKLNKNRLTNETTYEYYNRLDYLGVNNKLRQLTDIFNKARYSKEKISFEEMETVFSAVDDIETYIKINLGLLKFTINKYIITVRLIRKI